MTTLRLGLALYGITVALIVWGAAVGDEFIFAAGCLVGMTFCGLAWWKGPYR